MSSSNNLVDSIFLLFRLLLGFVFVASGILKLISPQQASELLSDLTTLNGWISRVVILVGSVIELLLGLLLMVGGKYLRIASLASSVALLAFTFVGLWALQNPRPCGCFGDMFEFKTDEYFVARNLFFLLLSMLILRYSIKHSRTQTGKPS